MSKLSLGTAGAGIARGRSWGGESEQFDAGRQLSLARIPLRWQGLAKVELLVLADAFCVRCITDSDSAVTHISRCPMTQMPG